MALAETTLAAAVAQNDTQITVASATSVAAGRLLQVDGEYMQVTKGYVTSSTTVPVVRGRDGSAQVAHVTAARVVHGDAADWGKPGAGTASQFAPAGRPRRIRSYNTTASMDLPQPGEDLIVRMDSTAFTLTVPVPTLDLDGCRVTFVNASGAAHVLVFTGGLGGASTGYTTVTANATGGVAFEVIAMNETWRGIVAIPASGTVTNITSAVS